MARIACVRMKGVKQWKLTLQQLVLRLIYRYLCLDSRNPSAFDACWIECTGRIELEATNLEMTTFQGRSVHFGIC